MSELQGFPFKNQLKQVDLDKLPDVNSHMECLPTCLASALQYLLRKEYEGEQIDHAVYGKNYIGGTSAIEYVHWAAVQGVRLYSISGNTAYLVEQVHKHLALGHPVVGTIPSTYLPPADPFNPGMSHCIVFYKDFPGGLAAMNPWEAFSQANTDKWWADRFCFGQVWVLERMENKTLGVPTGWKDDGKTLTAPNGHKVVLGFRSHVLSQPNWNPDNQPLEEEHGSEQLFAGILLTYDPAHGVREVYIGPQLFSLEKTSTDLHNQVEALRSDYNNLMGKYGALEKVNEQMNTELDQKDALIKSLQSAPQSSPASLKSELQSLFEKFLDTLGE